MRAREEEREAEAEELGALGGLGAREERPLFLPTPPFMASADEEKGMVAFPLLLSLVISVRIMGVRR